MRRPGFSKVVNHREESNMALSLFAESRDVIRFGKMEGFHLFNNHEHCTFGRVFSRYPVINLVLLGRYILLR